MRSLRNENGSNTVENFQFSVPCVADCPVVPAPPLL